MNAKRAIRCRSTARSPLLQEVCEECGAPMVIVTTAARPLEALPELQLPRRRKRRQGRRARHQAEAKAGCQEARGEEIEHDADHESQPPRSRERHEEQRLEQVLIVSARPTRSGARGCTAFPPRAFCFCGVVGRPLVMAYAHSLSGRRVVRHGGLYKHRKTCRNANAAVTCFLAGLFTFTVEDNESIEATPGGNREQGQPSLVQATSARPLRTSSLARISPTSFWWTWQRVFLRARRLI